MKLGWKFIQKNDGNVYYPRNGVHLQLISMAHRSIYLALWFVALKILFIVIKRHRASKSGYSFIILNDDSIIHIWGMIVIFKDLKVFLVQKINPPR